MSAHSCPGCGLDLDAITPADAKVAIRSFPRRYRAALAAGRDDEPGLDGESVLHRRTGPSGRSALDWVAVVVERLESLAGEVHRARVGGRVPSPAAGGSDGEPPQVDRDGGPTGRLDGSVPDHEHEGEGASARDGDSADDLLARLEAAVTRLGDEVDRVASDEWTSPASSGAGGPSVLALVRDAVHEGSHHLHDVERAVDAARIAARRNGS